MPLDQAECPPCIVARVHLSGLPHRGSRQAATDCLQSSVVYISSTGLPLLCGRLARQSVYLPQQQVASHGTEATVPGQHTLAHACALASCCHPHSPVVLPLAGPAVRAAVVGVGVVNALVAAAVATGTNSQQQDSTLPMRATALHCSRSPRLPSLPQESCDKTHWNSQQQEVSLAGMHRRFYTAIEHGARWTR